MGKAKTIWRQLQAPLSRAEFQAIVRAHRGDWHVHFVDCWSHFLCLLWAQLTGRVSLRDIEEEAEAHWDELAACGVQSAERSTVSRANRQRPFQIVAAFCDALLARYGRVTGRAFHCAHPLYSIDATVIDLCQALFPWAFFRRAKAGIKAHVLWDHRRAVPTLLNVTPAHEREFRTARRLTLPPGSILCCDAGYLDFDWFRQLGERGITVITRPRVDWTYALVERRGCAGQEGVTSDHMVRLTGPLSRQKYPGLLRRVRSVDPQTKQAWIVMTTNLDLPAATVVALYRKRWEIEEFFRWIKKNLQIQAFWGTSYNAVMWQLFTAFALYLLLAYLKEQMKLGWSLFQIQRKLRAYAYTRLSLQKLLAVKSHTAT